MNLEEIKKKYPLSGRPVAFATPQDLEEKIYEFLAECFSRAVEVTTKNGVETIVSPAPTTLEAFCVFAGITKTTFYAYGKKPKFKHLVSQYHQIVEKYWVDQCAEGKPGNKADFILKNAFSDNWKDETEVKLKGKLKTVAVKFVENEESGRNNDVDIAGVSTPAADEEKD